MQKANLIYTDGWQVAVGAIVTTVDGANRFEIAFANNA